MKLPRDVNGDQAARALTRLGFTAGRQSGSHLIMRKEERSICVPMHKPLKPGTLRAIIRQADLTVQAFTDAL